MTEIDPETPSEGTPKPTCRPFTTLGPGPATANGLGAWLANYPTWITLILLALVAVVPFARKDTPKEPVDKFLQAFHHTEQPTKPKAGATSSGGSGTHRIRTIHNMRDDASFALPQHGELTGAQMFAHFRRLEEAQASELDESYTLHLPLAYLFETPTSLSDVGKRTMMGLADHVRKMPFDVVFQVHQQSQVASLFPLVKFMTKEGRLPAGRLGISYGTGPDEAKVLLSVLLVAKK